MSNSCVTWPLRNALRKNLVNCCITGIKKIDVLILILIKHQGLNVTTLLSINSQSKLSG